MLKFRGVSGLANHLPGQCVQWRSVPEKLRGVLGAVLVQVVGGNTPGTGVLFDLEG